MTLLHELGEGVKAFALQSAAYTAAGSALLYVIGYLVLRFHLSVIGIATELSVLDERYLFAGAHFMVYLLVAVPNILLLSLPIAAAAWLTAKLVAPSTRATWRKAVDEPRRLAGVGILFSILMIQLVMKQCLLFQNMLLASQPPSEPAWLATLLRDEDNMTLFFSALVSGCAVPLVILFRLWYRGDGPAGARWLLSFLVTTQLLLLPVNFGVLIKEKTLARVTALGDAPLQQGEQAWLVWEGEAGITFFLRDQARSRRSLITLSQAKVTRIEIVGFDRIVPKLFEP